MIEFNQNLDKASALEIAREGFEDPVFFSTLIIPHWFKHQPLTWYQRGILAILCRKSAFLSRYGDLDLIREFFVWRQDPDDPKSPKIHLFEWNEDRSGLILHITKYTLLMIPRGFSKTTTVNAFVLWNAAYAVFKFPVYVSETQTHSETQLANVRLELESNARFIALYGDQRPVQRKGLKWTQDILQLSNSVVIAARGRGGQIRGMLVNGQRPDLIIPDDLEDKESVRTAEQRDKAVEWFFGDLAQALPRGDQNVGIVALGTLLHSDALLAKLRSNPEWNTVILGASLIRSDGTEIALWDDANYGMTLEQIELKKSSFARVGKLEIFYLEYYNTIRAGEGQKFPARLIIIPSQFDPNDFPFRAIACDPAISESPDADFFALGVVGRSEKGRLAVLDSWGARGVPPSEQAERFFDMRARWGKPRFNGVEAIAYQRALAITIREMMFRKKDYFEVIEIKHARKGGKTESKDERILGILQPRYFAGYIVHARHFPELESQLLDFPYGKKDFPDVVAMAVALLDPTAALVMESDPDENEYEPLEKILGADYFGAP